MYRDKKYNYSPHDANVAYAIVTGILKRDEIPAELLQAISNLLVFYESLKEEGELKEPMNNARRKIGASSMPRIVLSRNPAMRSIPIFRLLGRDCSALREYCTGINPSVCPE